MDFEATTVRDQGRIKPKHLLWSAKCRGQLFVSEAFDKELNRSVRTARLITAGMVDLLRPLHDPILVYASVDRWTLTGWEKVENEVESRAYAQSWVLTPGSSVDKEAARNRDVERPQAGGRREPA